jgi:hypothetical protein
MHIRLADLVQALATPRRKQISLDRASDLIEMRWFVFRLVASKPLLDNMLEQLGRILRAFAVYLR